VAAGVDAALLQQLGGIIVKDFQQLFLAPIVLSQEDGGSAWRNVQNFCNVLQTSLHFWD
jgi:hypothetical protein